MDLFGVVGLSALALVVVVILLAAVFFLRKRFAHSSGEDEQRTRPAFSAQQRLEVLETTDIDDERRLVLVRCDGIEHLIMTGGPADVVVENDVRKARGPAPAGSRAGEPDRSLAALMAAPAAPAPQRPRAADAPRHAATNGAGAPRQHAAGIAPQPARGATAQPASVTPEPQPVEREAAPQWRNPQPLQPVTARAVAAAPAPAPAMAERRTAPARQPEELPSAPTQWPEANSLEDEIVEALRFERTSEHARPATPTAAPIPAPMPVAQQHREPPVQHREPVAQHREPPAPHRELTVQNREPPARERRDTSGATLGDLAERLEEALAREVQFSNQGHDNQRDFEPDFEQAPPQERPENAEPRRRLEPKRQEARTPAPEPEARRENGPDRREEAPVISLNSRRREAVDPLEDEMARLLGELTGDTKSR